MDDNLTKILTLLGALILGIFLGKLIFGRKKDASIENITVKEPPKKILLRTEATLEIKHTPPPEQPKPASTFLEEKILYEEELSLLLKIGQEISSSLSIDDIAKNVVDNVSRILNVQICSILTEDKNKDLQIKYAIGLNDDIISSVHIKKGASISGRVFASNEHIVINDMHQDLRFRNINEENYYVRTLLSVPISIKGDVLAVLNVSCKKTEQPFTSEDVRFMKGIAAEAAIALNSAKLYEELQQSYLKTITVLASTIDAKDPYTFRHSENVTKFVLAIAQEMKLPQVDIENLRIASLLHDIGKIAIRDGILSKPGKLTDEEFKEIQKHVVKGEEILNVIPFLKRVSLLVRHHHEWFDGSRGYPDKIKNHQIELGARIISVADSLDAMISDRPYRKALTLPEACEELKKNSGTQFDPEIVGVFMRIMETKPELLKK